jgi:aspartate/methionine/tyrosine aminotransferase
MVKAFDERRGIIVDELNALEGFNCVTPLGAFYAYPNIAETGRTSQQLQDLMLDEAGVATVSGTSFGSFGEGYVRFSYANSAENIREAMSRIRAVL